MSVLKLIYTTPHESRVRTQPLAVLALGLSRSGTDSLRTALEKLGYTTYHGFQVVATDGAAREWTLLADRKWNADARGETSKITAHDFDRLIGHLYRRDRYALCGFRSRNDRGVSECKGYPKHA